MRHTRSNGLSRRQIYAECLFSASIDCNIEQCAKPTKFYEELGCKAVFGAKSCCAKRFECPDFRSLDDNKCTFDGKEYSIGEILPRGNADTAKCIETCFCTRSVCISFSSPFHFCFRRPSTKA